MGGIIPTSVSTLVFRGFEVRNGESGEGPVAYMVYK